MWSQIGGGREVIKLGPAPLVEDTGKEWDYTSSKILPGGKQEEPHIGQPKPRVWHQEDESPPMVFKPVGQTGGL